MNLRFGLVAAVVAVAAGAALLRTRDSAPVAPVASIVSARSARAALAVSRAEPARGVRAPLPLPAKVVVYVAGEVVRAGVYALPARSRAVDALHAAGGAAPDADLVAIDLAEPLVDGEEIVLVPKGSTRPVTSVRRRRKATVDALPGSQRTHAKKRRRRKRAFVPASEAAYRDAASGDASSADPPAGFVDINTADESELETLPGIGAALAARIVAMREANGPFASADDLLDVGGLTPGKLDALLPYVVVR